MTSVNRLYLVRHGENPANLTHEFSCRKVDYSLTDKGRLQALQTGEALARVRFAALWTSPLKRAHETAQAVAKHHSQPLQVHESLREMDVGELEGMQPQSQAWGHYAETMKAWLAGNTAQRFPGGESRNQLIERFRAALLEVTSEYPGENVLVVGHGGLFTHGVAHLCGVPDPRAFFSQENHNCSISQIELVREKEQTRFVLVEWAAVGHLSGEAALVVESVPEAFRAKNL